MENNTRRQIIKIENINAGYENKIAIENATLTIYKHDFLGVIGPNGGGKTTLMKVLLGLLNPQSGTITYYKDGKETDKITMGYLPQYSKIDRDFPISVYEVVLSGLSNKKPFLRPFTKEQKQHVADTINYMQLSDIVEKPIGALSGGQLQRVLLARAIVSDPEVLVLDEPNTYIDQRYQEQMYEMLNEINKHCAIILVSHDIGTILQNVKDVACVNKTLHYHPNTEVPEHEINHIFGCPIELLGHGDMPHRILKKHAE
ncbi:MAG: metal ABC transporter ATP-binding protein [Prevotella sp.]|nr:metal ABC transporter ATP-binding protein [Prevotella sp.]